MIIHPDIATYRGKGLFWLTVLVPVHHGGDVKERKAAGHMVPTVRKQRAMNAGAQLTFFIDPTPGTGATYF